jgi:nitrogen fixation NifU-like protein
MRYSDAVLDRVREPRCAGSWSSAAENVGTGEAGSLESGTLIRVQVHVEADRVVEARFKAFGCSAAIASASFVAEHLGGLMIGDAQALVAGTVVDALELPAERVHVASLAVEAAQSAIEDVRRAHL